MKKIFLNIALVAFIGTAMVSCKDNSKDATTGEEKDAVEAADTASNYNVDTSKSVIMWKGEKPTGIHTGTIKLSGGSVAVTDNQLEAGNFTIDMNSLENSDLEGDMKANLESHLKGTVEGKEGDFFNVNEFPKATFEITSIEGTQYQPIVKGNLTIKGKTHNVEFPAMVSYPENTIFLKSKKFMIDRTKWDVNYGSKSIFDNLGDKFINDQMEIQVELHANKV
jgi:polyisoprenoid-binding protein YceI